MSGGVGGKQCSGLISEALEDCHCGSWLASDAADNFGLETAMMQSRASRLPQKKQYSGWLCQPRQIRQFFRCVQAHAFLPVEFTADQADLTFGYTERLGQKGQQMGVGFAFYRWGGEADLQTFTVQAGELIAAGLGLQVAVENQVLAVPTEVAHQIRPNNTTGIPTYIANGGIT